MNETELRDAIYRWTVSYFNAHSMPVKAVFLSRLYAKKFNKLGMQGVDFGEFLEQDSRLVCKVSMQGGRLVVPRELFGEVVPEEDRLGYWNKFGASAF